MTKEKESLEGMFNLIKSQSSFEEAQKYYDILDEAINRLEAIDNAGPSEALKCLDKIISSFNETTTGMYGLGEVVVGNELIYFHEKELEVIEDALRQAKEDKMELEKYRRDANKHDNLYL